MNNFDPFEKEIKQTYRLPAYNPDFFNRLETTLKNHNRDVEFKPKNAFRLARGWMYAVVMLIFLGILSMVIGPTKVLAQIKDFFGFIPNVGLVDTSSPFRQLAEPVNDTKDGVSVTITSAFISADQTLITYEMSDLPDEIKRGKFGTPECIVPASLTFPDGSTIEASEMGGNITSDGGFEHGIRFNSSVPEGYNQAVLSFPCLEGTAREKGPQNWRFSLTFEPVEEDQVVYPAALMPSLDNIALDNNGVDLPAEVGNTASVLPAGIVDGDPREEMVVLAVVEKPESYWVTWAFSQENESGVHVNGQKYIIPFNPVLYDANGAELPQPDFETQIELWEYEEDLRAQLSDQDLMKFSEVMHTFVVPKSGIAFPVFAKQNVYEQSFPEKEAYAEVEFDGTLVQNSDEPLEINQVIHIGSVTIRLEAIQKSSFGSGYSFRFDGAEGKVVQCVAYLPDYPTDIKGSGSFDLQDPFHFYQDAIYLQLPTGKMTVRISQPAVLGDLVSFIGIWSPEQ